MIHNRICICGDYFSQHVGEVNPRSVLSDCPGFEADPKTNGDNE